MLRAAIITDQSFFSEKVDGGVQAVTKYLVDALTRIPGLDLHVISFRYDVDAGRTSAHDGYSSHVLPGARFGTLTGFSRDQQTLDSCLERIQPDIVHGQGAGHNGILAVRSRYPSIVTIHGIMAEEAKFYSGIGNRMRHRLLSRLSDRYCISRAEHTVLISPYVSDYFKDRLAGEHYLIPNPIGKHFFEVQRHETDGRVLFAGRLYALKGVMDLLKAAALVARSRKLELVLAGALTDKEYVRRLKDEAARSGIGEAVQFRGLLGEQELLEELGRAAVLVLPSYQETAPMVVVEAMAAGVPVIATHVGGTGYLVEDGRTGFLVPPGDIDALSDKLLTLLSDASLRRAFGAAAKTRATETYHADNVARRTVDAYRQVLRASGGP